MPVKCEKCGNRPINCTCPKWLRFMAAICNRCLQPASSCTCKRGV